MTNVKAVDLQPASVPTTGTKKKPENENQNIQIFVNNSKEKTQLEQETRLHNRAMVVAQKMNKEENKKTIFGGNLFVGSTISLVLGGLAALATRIIKSSPRNHLIGLIGSIALLLTGGGLMLWGMHTQNAALSNKNKIVNYKNGVTAAGTTPETKKGASSFLEKIGSWIYGDAAESTEVPDQDKIADAAKKIQQEGKFSDVYLTELDAKDKQEPYVQVTFADTNLQEYSPQTIKEPSKPIGKSFIDNKQGYDVASYNIHSEYKNVLKTFADVNESDGHYNIKKSQLDAMKNLTKTMATKDLGDDIKLLDVTGDGHINEADFLALGYISGATRLNDPAKVKSLLSIWKQTDDFESALKQVYPEANEQEKLQLRKLFNISSDKNKFVGEDDLAFFGNLQNVGAKDINADGVIDFKDAQIIESYVIAMKQEIARRSENMDAIAKALGYTPTEAQMNEAKKALGV